MWRILNFMDISNRSHSKQCFFVKGDVKLMKLYEMRSSISSDPPMTNVAVFELGLPRDAVSLLSKGEHFMGEKNQIKLGNPQ